MDYYSFCEENRDILKFSFKECINDTTLIRSYFLQSNVCCDGNNWYISNNITSVRYSRKEIRKKIARLIKIIGHKPRLSGIDNTLGYTRLIYSF